MKKVGVYFNFLMITVVIQSCGLKKNNPENCELSKTHRTDQDLTDYEQEALGNLKDGPFMESSNNDGNLEKNYKIPEIDVMYSDLIVLENSISITSGDVLLKKMGEAAFALQQDKRFDDFKLLIQTHFKDKEVARQALLELCNKHGYTFTLAMWYNTESEFKNLKISCLATKCFVQIFTK